MTYINIKNNNLVETVDEFESIREACKMIKEYRLADRYNNYYLSSRSTREWRDQTN